jgi:hypothetical protein
MVSSSNPVELVNAVEAIVELEDDLSLVGFPPHLVQEGAEARQFLDELVGTGHEG